MKKTRMSIDDIHAMVGSIRANVVNMRVTNIYDVQGQSDGSVTKTYVLKLQQPPFPKVFLLLESGVRFHTSQYARNATSASNLPSQFTMKLRKHLRGKRLSALTQLEGDRVVDLTFGHDAFTCHLILELYASGNIILTDDKYRILSLLRTHRFDENVKMAVKQEYPVQLLGDHDKRRGIQTTSELVALIDVLTREQGDSKFGARGTLDTTQTKKKKKKTQTIKQLLLMKGSTFGGLGPAIIEHCLVCADIAPTMKIKTVMDATALGDTKLLALLAELQKGWKLLARLCDEQVSINGPIPAETEPDASTAGDNNPSLSDFCAAKDSSLPAQKCGYIILKDSTDTASQTQYEEFTPFLYAQHSQKKVKSFDTFDEAVDEYFSRFETETAEVAKQSAQLAAENKLAKLKKNQEQQLAQLREAQEQSLQQARLIEVHQQDVENVLLVIRSALASGMDWSGLEGLVKYEQKNGNPVATLIHKLDLEHNRVAVLLCDDDESAEGEDGGDGTGVEDRQAHPIWIDLSLSALANAREIYTKKKKAGAKAIKASEATDKAIELAEKNTLNTLKTQQMKRNVIYQRRKTLWFEKFHWFLTNEKHLVIAGKDAHQNEQLVKRYLRKGDVYVHADLHGAATCIVRNRAIANDRETQEFPPIAIATLEQAGCMSVCRSSAWSSQVIAGAYWVHADQVSKTAPTGEYLTTGSFMIRGKKNYIQPSRLEMGLAILFRIDESSVSNHARPSNTGVVHKADDHDEKEVSDNSNMVREAEQALHRQDMTVTEKNKEVADETRSKSGNYEGVTIAAREANDVNPEVEKGGVVQQAQRDGRKRLSIKERRDMKKGKPPVSEDTVDGADDHSSQPKKQAQGAETREQKLDEGDARVPKQKKNIRGKKGKMKKMKKYADQDDDDRRLRMEALGHVIEETNDTAGEHGKSSKCVEPRKGEDDSDDSPAVGTDTIIEATDEYIRQQRERKEKFLDEQEVEAESVVFFDTFTGEPLPNDMVLFAMPMCAPYASLSRFKYKVKLTPGSQKKGKAAKQAMDHFFASNLKEEKDMQKPQPIVEADDIQPDVNPLAVQRELMRCIPDNELVNCMVGPVKLSAPGLNGHHASKRASGKAKKSRK